MNSTTLVYLGAGLIFLLLGLSDIRNRGLNTVLIGLAHFAMAGSQLTRSASEIASYVLVAIAIGFVGAALFRTNRAILLRNKVLLWCGGLVISAIWATELASYAGFPKSRVMALVALTGLFGAAFLIVAVVSMFRSVTPPGDNV